MITLSTFILGAYVILIGCLAYGFHKIQTFKITTKKPVTTFSIIIPFRNEAENLPKLLASLFTLNYPKNQFEVILVNDASEDHSVELIQTLTQNQDIDLKIIQNERHSSSPKKDAITSAINQAKFDWIITTDADCILPKFWLDSFDAYIKKKDVFCVAAPVTYHIGNSFLNHFQCLDILSLQGATLGGFGLKKPFMCNGANFAYKKSLFIEVAGFNGNGNIASGDDLFFLEKVLKTHPNKLGYLKSEATIVKTNAQECWKQLISQRVRWAAKTTAYNNGFGKFTGVLVLLANLVIALGFVLSLFGLFPVKTLVVVFALKFGIDFLLLLKTVQFFQQTALLKSFFLSACLYPFFSIYVAFNALFSNYNWKGRTFKR